MSICVLNGNGNGDGDGGNNKEIKDNQLLKDYKNLVTINVYNMTDEEMQRLKEIHKEKSARHEALQKLTARELWLSDLNELEKLL